jgi:hypothetical protein
MFGAAFCLVCGGETCMEAREDRMSYGVGVAHRWWTVSRVARVIMVSTRPAASAAAAHRSVAGTATSSASGAVWAVFHADHAMPSAQTVTNTAIQNTACGFRVRM